jgi:phenylpropionate dioxygenase-like ring-hydroxylating dioxygenase large terminal subunit
MDLPVSPRLFLIRKIFLTGAQGAYKDRLTMMTIEQNRLVTETGASTPAGTLLRRYWQPAALSEELRGPRSIRPVKIMGQDLVLFRDESGQLGLLDRHCTHRGADLAFGRLEDGGLRCLFHGWLFDRTGRCLDTPAEPEGRSLCSRVKQPSYRVVERNGMIFAYLGSDEPPVLPALDCFVAPDSHVFAFKGYLDCNWLQALEVGVDPAHASFLHRFFEDEDASGSYGKQFRATSADSEMPMTRVLREFARPRISVKPSDSGFQIFALRDIGAGKMHVRVTNLLFPQAFVIPMSAEMTITQWHVPIDDYSCYWYALFTSFTAPVDKEQMRRQRLELYTLPDYKPRVGRFNNYGYDWDDQQRRTYTGMGQDINVHDQWAVESQGRIQDRTREHLGTTDKAIVTFRKMLMDEIRKAGSGERTLMQLDTEAAARITGPATMDGVGPADSWESYWRAVDERRRSGAPWNGRRHEPAA